MKAFRKRDLVVLIACLAFVSVFVIYPARLRSAERSKRISCTCNLKQVGLSFRTWTLDCGDSFPMRVSVASGGTMETISNGLAFYHFQVISNELGSPKVLVCPADGFKKPATDFVSLGNANLSYFVGVDATDTNPNMFLAGDDNLMVNGVPAKPGLLILATNSAIAWSQTRHHGQGNVAMADGSVQQFSSQHLAEALRSTVSATNRFLMP
jgi:prepilin-type processing-associated H-X9-DG protein